MQICPYDMQRVGMDHMEPTSTVQDKSSSQKSLFVRPTEQKGRGLSTLKNTLDLMTSNAEMQPSNTEDATHYREMRQRQLEKDAVQAAVDRWTAEMQEMREAGIDITGGGKKLGPTLNQWFNDLVVRIEKELAFIKEVQSDEAKQKSLSTVDRERVRYGIYLAAIPAEKLAAATILHMVHLFAKTGASKGIKSSTVIVSLGKELRDEAISQETLQAYSNDTKRLELVRRMLENRKKRMGRVSWKKIVEEAKERNPGLVWSDTICVKVGGMMLSFLHETAQVPVRLGKDSVTMQPAFQHSYEVRNGKKYGMIHLHQQFADKLFREPPPMLLARHMPMLTEPRPWKGFEDGGYLGYPSQIMRCTPGDVLQRAYMEKSLENDGLKEVRAGLDVLGKTAWVINKDVFEVMVEAWNSGEAIAKIPPLDPQIPYPEKPANADPEAEKAWRRAVREVENKLSGYHSNRCFTNFQMEIARAFLDETFYLPHNMDFRGRAYPLPSYLNQMGADNARALLLFKNGKPLGESGLRWLKIHLSNVFGFDKASLKEREEFANQHLDDILDSANNGLHGRRWFLQAEDPWQCLAACCELRNALRLEDPTQYPSRLPIHQDGSCNGLQHYAALGGDVEGAQQVNLMPADRPSDVYTAVAEFVKDRVAQEAKQGHRLAKLLDGKIKRKIVKQTVMTNVYGVTFIGAVRQVKRQLVDHYPDLEDMNACAQYVARNIFIALGSIFSGAHDIQYWLGDCASRICQSVSPAQIDQLIKEAVNEGRSEVLKAKPSTLFKSTMIWTTPLGLPVVQPYRKQTASRVQTSLQSLTLAEPSATGPVSKRKQLQAFPPNFIHSLDATHMMLSAIECHKRGLDFAAVHDSFWTHACDVDTMSSVLRECFIRMHSDDIIRRLAAEFRARYDGYMFLAKIPRRSKIAKKILQFRKGRKSKNPLEELVVERQRQILLQSDDPELQAKGRAMETAGSIFEAMGGTHDDLEVSATLGETGPASNPEEPVSEEALENVENDATDPFDADSAFAAAEEDTLDQDDDLETTTTTTRSKSSKSSSRSKANPVWVWLPLTFRDIPKKGEFDVALLRKSRYFFS